jgi:NhaP-type Na+/H+ or K+/H+ antiporter
MLVFGESAINDAVAITLFRTLAAFVPILKTPQEVMVYDPFFLFLLLFFGSIAIGVAIALLCSLLFKFLSLDKTPNLELALFVLCSYLPYVLGEGLGLSGILCVLFSGMAMGHYAHYSLSPISQITSKYVRMNCNIKCRSLVSLHLWQKPFALCI